MSKPRSKSKKNPQPVVASPAHREPFVCASAQTCYEHFAPIAKAVPVDGLETFKISVDIARANASWAVEALRPHVETLQRKLPECPVADLLEIHELSLALMYAAGKVVVAVSQREIEERLSSLRPMRELTLQQLEIFAALGLLDKAVPVAIRKGTGPLDAARDGQQIAGVFAEHAADFAGRHPFTKAQLDKLREDADWLVPALRPASAKVAPTERDPAAILRDQLGAMLVDRYELARQAGGVLFGTRALDEHIPPLGARIASARSSTPETPAPAAPANG